MFVISSGTPHLISVVSTPLTTDGIGFTWRGFRLRIVRIVAIRFEKSIDERHRDGVQTES